MLTLDSLCTPSTGVGFERSLSLDCVVDVTTSTSVPSFDATISTFVPSLECDVALFDERPNRPEDDRNLIEKD